MNAQPQLNVDLLLEAADAIELYPDHFCMLTYWGALDGVNEWEVGDHRTGDGTPAECDTTACVAGWVVSLAGERQVRYTDIGATAARLLGDPDPQGSLLRCGTEDDLRNGLFYRCDLTADTAAAFLRGIAKGEILWSDDEGWYHT